MKKIITLSICFLVLLPSFAQKLNYETDSKWHLGFNVGGTWSTTDVQNKTNLGWGLTLGRAFNYNYGKIFSYDLRLRYLGGNWYGQDYDTTHVTNNGIYSPGGPVHKYYDSLGYTINNFNNEAHELGLELVIHVNRWRENTGFDPYIFGGIGLAWNKTMGDLYFGDSLNALTSYPYPADGMSKAQWNQLSDDIYDTPLDGSTNAFAVNLTPSLGVGLAYQVGPRFSIGLEHRTMFSLRNTFDGYAGTATKWGLENDLYHYTGLSLKFHIGKGETGTDVNPNNGTNNNLNNGGVGCKTPSVSIRKPNQANSTSSERDYLFEAVLAEVAARENIHLFVNGSESTNFTYDPNSGKLESQLYLQNGNNEIRVQVTNACGTDEERVMIHYVDCFMPMIQFTQPSGASVSANTPMYTVSANIQQADQVTMQVNGVISNAFNYNGATFSANLNLRNGANTVRVIARNDCGEVEETVTISYTDCVLPAIIVQSGTGTITVTEPLYNFRAEVQNVLGKQNIQFLINGVSKDFTYMPNNRSMKGSATLVPGMNTIVVNASNDCGTQSTTVNVIYNPCIAPVVSMMDPAGGSVTVNGNAYTVRAQISGVNQLSQVVLKVNGVVRTGGSFDAASGMYTHNLALTDGNNAVEIVATTNCGTGSAGAMIVKRACLGPQITMVQPATLVSNAATNNLAFSAQVLNISGAYQVQMILNGVQQSTGVYNTGTKMYTKNVPLVNGVNTIKLVATNDCSSQEITYTVNFAPCNPPVLTVVIPGSTNVNSAAASFPIQVNTQNVSTLNQIAVTVNGILQGGGSFNAAMGMFTQTLNLSAGANNVVVTATTECGTTTKMFTVNYAAPCPGPVLTVVSPGGTSVNSSAASFPIQVNTQNVSAANQLVVTVNGTVQGGGSFNAALGMFTQTLNLSAGANNVVVTATTQCGSASKAFTVNYAAPCPAPALTLISPASTNVSSASASFPIQLSTQNVNAGNQVVITVNGIVQGGGSFNLGTGMFTQNLNLSNGANNVVITATTPCGTATKNFTVSYAAPCPTPVLTVVTPGSTNANSPAATFPIQVNTQNVTAANQIVVTVNGAVQNGGSFNAGLGMFTQTLNLSNGANTVVVTATTPCGSTSKTFTLQYAPCVAPVVTISSPTNMTTSAASVDLSATVQNVSNVSQIVLTVNGAVQPAGSFNASTGSYTKTIALVQGVNTITLTATNECGTNKKKVEVTHGEEQKMIICHHPPGNPENTQQLEIPVSAWPAHQAHGDVIGPCPTTPPNNGGGAEEKMIICHHPPGNPENTQQLEIPVSAWPAHQAHGDEIGPCPPPAPNGGGTEAKMIICHYPPGNTDNPQQIEIPVSAWPAHQAHGDVVGPCPPPTPNNGGAEEKMTICHYPPGNKDNPQQIEIPVSAWPAHQAHGDVIGPCPGEEKGNGKGGEDPGKGNQPGEGQPGESKPRGGGK